jgi:hypothetical protein
MKPSASSAASPSAAKASSRSTWSSPSPAAYRDGLDDASNVVIDLIDTGRLDAAEHAAQHLLERFPEVHDGLERLAMVAAARGDRPRAAEYYRKAADFVHAHADQYGPKMEVYLRRRATEFAAPREEVSGDQAR